MSILLPAKKTVTPWQSYLSLHNVGFEEIIQSINDCNLLDIKLHPHQEKYKGQQILYVKVIDQVYAVPFVEEDENTIFLKTLFPSRKAKKEFLKNLKFRQISNQNISRYKAKSSYSKKIIPT